MAMRVRMRMRAAAVVWSAVAAGSGGVAAAQQDRGGEGEAVPIAIGLAEGETFAYQFSTELVVEQRTEANLGEEDGGGGGEEAELPTQTQSYDASARFTVVERGEEGFEAEVRMVVTSFAAAWGVGDEAGSVAADLEGLRTQLEGDEAAMAEAAAGQRAMAALSRAVGVIEIDAAGTVAGVRGFEAFERTVRSMRDVDDRAIGFFTNDQVLAMVRPVFEAEGAVGSVRREGDGWQSTRTVEVSNIGVLDYTYAWVVAGVRGDLVTMEGEADVSLRVPETRDARVPALTLESAEETVTSRWDAGVGHLVGREATFANALVFELSGAERSVRLMQRSEGSSSIERLGDAG